MAHRGLLLHAPENTLSNFRACLELRIGFEFDVQQTKDGQLVCIHDDSVNRTTNGRGKVADLTLEELRRLDAGSWFDRRFFSERVPTIEEVFKLLASFASHDVLVAVDLKAEGVEQEVVRLAQKNNVLPKLLFIGRTINERGVRESIKRESAKAQTSAVAHNAGEMAAVIKLPNTDWIYFRYFPTQMEMAAVRSAGKRVFIAGSLVSGNTPDNWMRAIELGFDGILTDYYFELGELIRQRSRPSP